MIFIWTHLSIYLAVQQTAAYRDLMLYFEVVIYYVFQSTNITISQFNDGNCKKEMKTQAILQAFITIKLREPLSKLKHFWEFDVCGKTFKNIGTLRSLQHTQPIH